MTTDSGTGVFYEERSTRFKGSSTDRRWMCHLFLLYRTPLSTNMNMTSLMIS